MVFLQPKLQKEHIHCMKLPQATGNKRALLVEGGGMKGAFAGGVLLGWKGKIDASDFDLVLGVSSGACSAAYFVSFAKSKWQKAEEVLAIWYRDLSGKKLINLFHPLRGKTFLDQEYLIDYIFREKVRLASERFNTIGVPEFRIAVSNLKTHAVEYVKATQENIFHLLKAATSLPIATRGKQILDGIPYSDAAILNPLPLKDLVEAGYKEIVIVMNNPLDHVSRPLGFWTSHMAFPLQRKVRRLMRKLHHFHFNSSRAMAKSPPPGIAIRTVAPEAPLPVKLTGTSKWSLWKTALLGVEAGKKTAFSFRSKRAPEL